MGQTRTIDRLTWLAGALASLLLLSQAIYLWDFAIDDVGISYRYALHLAQGEGLTWNPGDQPVEGYSNFLWVLILALGKFLGGDIVIISKLLGLVLAATALVIFSFVCKRVWGDAPYWWLPPVLVALTPELTAWAMSGLEIALYCLFLVLGLSAITSGPKIRQLPLAIAVCGLTLTRPEGFIFAILFLAFAAVSGDLPRPVPRFRRIGFAALSLLVVGAGLVAFRTWYYGYPLPNTVYAKYDTTFPSLIHVLKWLLFAVPFLVGIVWLRRYVPENRTRWMIVVASGLVILQALICLPVKPVMYFIHRYQVAFLPFLALSAPLLLRRATSSNRTLGAVAAGLLVLWCMQGWPEVLKRYHQDRYVYEQQKCVANRLGDLPGRPTIAVVDAGRIPYWTDLPAIDAWGLCDIEIAREGFAPEFVLKRKPPVYIISMDVDRGGEAQGMRLRAHLGMDIMTTKVSDFTEHYGLWKICSPGQTPNIGDSAIAYYDYGVFLDSSWARGLGLAERLHFVEWEY